MTTPPTYRGRVRLPKGPPLDSAWLRGPPIPLERELVDAIRDMLSAYGALHWSGRIFVKRGRRTFLPALGTGTPDIIGVVRGRMFAIEVKRSDKDKERPAQTEWMRQARAAGVACGTARTVHEALDIFHQAERA
jgi:hypothetical protein